MPSLRLIYFFQLTLVCFNSYAITPRHWDYQHSHEWARVSKSCAGNQQSPINIQTKDLKHIDMAFVPVRFSNERFSLKAYDNGHSLGFKFHPKSVHDMVIGNETYQLLSMHFHSHSEHTLDNKYYPIELHLLLSEDGYHITRVVAVLVEEGASHGAIKRLLAQTHSQREVNMSARELNSLLPKKQNCYHYIGSLTTPPCFEGIEWLVFQHPIHLSSDQIKMINAFHRNNFRPLQHRMGRSIKFSH